MAVTCYVDGSPVPKLIDRWSISKVANGRNRANFRVLSSDGLWFPEFSDIVLFKWHDGTTRIFGGHVNESEDMTVENNSTEITHTVSAIGFTADADRVYRTLDIPEGTLKSFLEVLVVFIPSVTLDVGQDDGPTIPATTFNLARIDTALNQLVILSGGWVYRVDDYQVLKMIEPGSVAAPFNITAASKIRNVKVRRLTASEYFNHIIVQGNGGFVETVEDAGEVASRGSFEILISAQNAYTSDEAINIGNQYLARSLPLLKRLEYEIDDQGMEPCQSQTVTLPARGLSGDWLVTEVKAQHFEGDIVRWTVSLIEGTTWREGWRESLMAGPTSGGVTSYPGGGGGGSVIYSRPVMQLSVGIEQYSDSGPTWTAASKIQVKLDTVSRGTTAATVTVGLRVLDSGNSVQARLARWNGSAWVAAGSGVSSVITATSFGNPEAFDTTLEAGEFFYRLEVLPGVADQPVEAYGHVQ